MASLQIQTHARAACLGFFLKANSEQPRRAVVVPLAQGRFQVTRI
jgi:hypothetical protein